MFFSVLQVFLREKTYSGARRENRYPGEGAFFDCAACNFELNFITFH